MRIKIRIFVRDIFNNAKNAYKNAYSRQSGRDGRMQPPRGLSRPKENRRVLDPAAVLN